MNATKLKAVRIFSTKGAIVRVVVPVSQVPRVSVGSSKCCCNTD